MIPKFVKYFAIALAVLIVFGILFRGRIGTWLRGEKVMASRTVDKSTHTTAERKVLYWYDAMEPQHHYDKAGKAPDGMDLVAKYAEESHVSGNSGDMADMPGMDMSQNQAGSKATPQGERKVLYYYDAMNPVFRSDKPGTAPDGMALVPKYADEVEAMKNMPAGTVMLSSDKQQLIGVRTSEVSRGPLVRTIRTTGHLTADETKLAHIHVKVPGWVQDIGVDYVGQLVKKDQFLFSVYSPDLVSTEQEYLIALRGQSYLGKAPYRDVSEGAQSLLRATRERLHLWDVSDEQIEKLEKTGEVTRTTKFYSPVSGFVMDRKAFPQSWVEADKELYTLADLSNIWVYVDIYEYEVPYVHLGQQTSMQLSYYPGKTYTGRVTYVYPTVDPQTRTVRVRVEFPNPDFELKPQMFADVELKIDYGVHTLVPAEAVLDSGKRQLVFVVKAGGVFEPREVQVGPRVDEQYVILKGLKPGETVVSSGNFLIDSESRLSSATGGMSMSQ